MASYFNLLLDTTAPGGLTVTINSGAQYTTKTAVTLAIGLTDTPTTGYQMKVWGTATIANEAAATWESFATTKNVVLSTGDGAKTISVKVRDTVGNESGAATDTITLDTAVPAVTLTGPDVTVVSKISSYDTCAFGFQCDVIFSEYKVKVVPTTNSLHDAGTLIPVTGGSTNMSGVVGDYPATTTINCTIKGADLEAASAADGTKIVKVFVKNVAGSWSAA
ncbi:MAG: hypothetical protein RR365_11055 [Bacteroides sp.]